MATVTYRQIVNKTLRCLPMDLLDEAVFSKFQNRTAIRFYDSRCNLIDVVYGQLWKEMQKISESLKEQHIAGQLIGVRLPHCPALISILGGIIISGNSFCCLDNDGPPDYSMLRQYEECSAFLLPDCGTYDECDGLHLLLGMRISSIRMVLVVSRSSRDGLKEIAFSVRTSGSTGTPKTVLVPKSCIVPNVLALSARFQLTEHDSIFVCSPPTFDPFVIDIILGLRVGASLILVDNEVRLAPNRLVRLLFPGVTFMQITPSLFTRWSRQEMEDVILAPHSTLRILVLGGEKFPMLPLPPGSRTDVYNIYGITEVSCWSMMEKVTFENRNDVPLGLPLDQSIILELRCVENDQKMADKNNEGSTIGHLFIGSRTRKCIVTSDRDERVAPDILQKQSAQPLFRSTGDLVELTKDNQYFYRGRCGRIIKRFGCRVSLLEVEQTLLSHKAITQCAACAIGDDERLVLFFKSTSKQTCTEATVWKYLRKKLPATKLPDEIYHTEHIPLSSHGKICNDGLLNIYSNYKRRNRSLPCADLFRAELVAIGILDQSVLHSDIKRRKLSSFIDHGGTSMSALRLHATLEKELRVTLPNLLTLFLDNNVSLEEIFKYLESHDQNGLPGSAGLSPKNLTIDSRNGEQLTIVCRFDMDKCIDARPTVTFCKDVGHILSVGSHSGMQLTVSVETNAILSRISLPNRIECPTSFFIVDNKTVHGVVGCYDGFLYCFNPLTGCINWMYNAGAMIKSCPVVVPGTNEIIFGSYGSSYNLHCVSGCNAGAERWKMKIGSKPILAQAILFGGDGAGCVFVASLDGTIASVNVHKGEIIWSSTVSVPIFNTPAYFEDRGRVIVCRVDGILSVHGIVEGKATSSISLPGNVFSSFGILKRSAGDISLLVGSYDRSVHCIQYLPLQRDALLPKWKVGMQSQVYATPLVIGRYLLVCTTSGYINLVDLTDECSHGSNGDRIVSTLRMAGELFATPVVHKNTVFVGCRDNFLYKIMLKV